MATGSYKKKQDPLISLSGTTIMCSMGMIDYYVYLRRLFAMDNNKDDSFSYDDFDKAHGRSILAITMPLSNYTKLIKLTGPTKSRHKFLYFFARSPC
jgi:hypothetical protein